MKLPLKLYYIEGDARKSKPVDQCGITPEWGGGIRIAPALQEREDLLKVLVGSWEVMLQNPSQQRCGGGWVRVEYRMVG